MYLSSLWASLISTVWAAEHDYGHLCNTFVVNIVVWDDLLCIYRCVGTFVICHTLEIFYDACDGWFMYNALFILVMRWLTPPSVDRWERCGHAHEIWIIALVFRILSIMKYDVCRYGMADVTRHMYWVTCEIQPNILYLGVKRKSMMWEWEKPR